MVTKMITDLQMCHFRVTEILFYFRYGKKTGLNCKSDSCTFSLSFQYSVSLLEAIVTAD